MSKKRSRREVDRLADDFRGRMEWLESAWNCRTEFEVDLSTGDTWAKITFPGNSTALVIRCDVGGITVPGDDTPARGNDNGPPQSPPHHNP